MADIEQHEKKILTIELTILRASIFVSLLAIFVVVFCGYMYLQLPYYAKKYLDDAGSAAAKTKPDAPAGQATADPAPAAKSDTAETIKVGDKCFKPRNLVRCGSTASAGGPQDHLTWFENADECTKAGGQIEGQMAILAQCE